MLPLCCLYKLVESENQSSEIFAVFDLKRVEIKESQRRCINLICHLVYYICLRGKQEIKYDIHIFDEYQCLNP